MRQPGSHSAGEGEVTRLAETGDPHATFDVRNLGLVTPAAAPSAADLESAFAVQVATMLEPPPSGREGPSSPVVLRYSNRRKLLDLAARLGMGPFEANLLIERTRFRMAVQRGAAPQALVEGPATPLDPPGPAARRGKLTRWLIAIGLAILADAAAIIYLLPR